MKQHGRRQLKAQDVVVPLSAAAIHSRSSPFPLMSGGSATESIRVKVELPGGRGSLYSRGGTLRRIGGVYNQVKRGKWEHNSSPPYSASGFSARALTNVVYRAGSRPRIMSGHEAEDHRRESAGHCGGYR